MFAKFDLAAFVCRIAELSNLAADFISVCEHKYAGVLSIVGRKLKAMTSRKKALTIQFSLFCQKQRSVECYRSGVSNSRPSEPFNAAHEVILKFQMNSAVLQRYIFEQMLDPLNTGDTVWTILRGTDLFFFLEINSALCLITRFMENDAQRKSGNGVEEILER